MLRIAVNLQRAAAVVSVAGSMMTSVGLAQETQTQGGELRLGLVAGGSYNYVNAATQRFVDVPGSSGFATADFSKAWDVASYSGVMAEYTFNDLLGVQLRATFDDRIVSKEDGNKEFIPWLSYIAVEPALRVNLGMPELHLKAGPSVHFNVRHRYDYLPDGGEGMSMIDDAELANTRDVAFGAWGGIACDFRLTSVTSDMHFYLSPFIEASYLFDQKDPDREQEDFDERWNTLSARAGFEFKVDFGW